MKTSNSYRLIVSPAAQQLLGQYSAVIVWAIGLDNTARSGIGESYLRESAARARSLFSLEAPSGHPHIAAMRAAFSRFGAKPSKYPSSVESLAKRAIKGEIPSISDVVDVYNSVSLDYVIPLGGEDWNQLASDLTLKRALGTEPFITDSETGETTEYPEIGELVWCDELGVTCRRLNWRQCSRTAIRSGTTEAYFLMDGLPPFGVRELYQAAEELERRLRRVCPTAETAVDAICLPDTGGAN